MRRPACFEVFAVLGLATMALGCMQAEPRADVKREARDAVHDASITARIKTTYLFNRHLDSVRIHVETHDGVVALSGTVPSDRGTVVLTGEVESEAERQLAARVARDIEGVKHVVSQIQVRG